MKIVVIRNTFAEGKLLESNKVPIDLPELTARALIESNKAREATEKDFVIESKSESNKPAIESKPKVGRPKKTEKKENDE